LFAAGSALLYVAVNPLTMWLTFATFVGYAVVYTVFLKRSRRRTSSSAALPERCRRCSAGGDARRGRPRGLHDVPHHLPLDPAALLGVGAIPGGRLPPVGPADAADHPRQPLHPLHVLLYTLVLFAATLLPYVYGMSGLLYLGAALALGVAFTAYAWKLWREYSDALARRTFRFSIVYLAALFSALLIDHYLGATW
jgi:protoheme IX farnesyltransferase